MNSLFFRQFLNNRGVSLWGASVSRFFSDKVGKLNFDELVEGKPVVVFMKGTPDSPRCGFSNAVCQILKFHGVDNYKSYDVLSDEDIRSGVKEYTNWPTIPQVFFNGEFVGGCDLLLDMHKNGDLVEELKKIGIRSKLLDESPDQS